MIKHLKISQKLNLYISSLVISSMLITTGITYTVGKKEIEDNLKEKLHVVNHLKIERINNLFNEVDLLIKDLHDDGIVETYVDSLVNGHQHDSLRKLIPNATREVKENLTYRNEPSIINNVKIINLDGEIIFTETQKDYYDKKAESKFINPMSSHFQKAFNHTIYSGVYYDEYQDDFFMLCLSPLHHKGHTQALLLIEMQMKNIYNAISDTTGLGFTGETILCEFKNNKIHFISPLKYDTKNFLERDLEVTSPFASAAINSVLSKEGFISKAKDYNKIKVDAAWNYLPKLNWGIYSKINHEESFQSIYKLRRQLIIIAISLVLVCIFLAYLLTKEILKPINKIRVNMTKLAEGDFPETIFYSRKDEISSTINSMNQLVKRLKKSTELAQAIGSGRLNQQIEFDKSNDVLSRSLIEMKENLQKLDSKNQQQNWSNKGLTNISEIIRESSDNFETLSTSIINSLVNYVGAQFGAIYIRKSDFTASLKTKEHSEEYFYELVASYALFDNENSKTRFKPGQGLIGQSALEKKNIRINDIELEHKRITSGLGETKRGNILIVPLIINEEALGVIEIVSFTPIEDYIENFVIKIGENIASSILASQARDKKNQSLRQSELIIKELKTKQIELVQNQHEQHLKEQNLILENEQLKNQVEELKRELNFNKNNEN